ncbi:MAG: ATP-dependent Clp protease adaptor ClpS [Bacteroidales bacterium]|nr:ATP-dependent Clp protease adaptor ClpS [Bacteroidales bacterium]MBR5028211.1 ATP-dependent Clp protease adaptor ClpS [Bacteroidales bacterium]
MNQNLKEEELLQSADTLLDDNCKLVLYNDDYHTFDYVIDSLVDICKQTYEQAEQCTILVHYKGKCVVKTGTHDALMPMHQALLGKSLTSEIQ